MPIDRSAVTSAFAASASSWGGLEADIGQGSQGEWPPEGECPCYVTDISAQDGQFVYNDKDGKTQKVPATVIQFQFLTMEPIPTREEKEPLQWKGERFVLPKDRTQLNQQDNQRIRLEIADRRLKGHLQTILSRESSDPGADLIAASEKVEGGKVAVKVNCVYRKSVNKKDPTKTNIYKTEFLTESLSG